MIEMSDVLFIKNVQEKISLFIGIDFRFLRYYCVCQKNVVILQSERWQSGLMRLIDNQVNIMFRGFESPPFLGQA